jgi:putative transposase
MRTRRVKVEGKSLYHCMSRVIQRQFVLGDGEKEYFCRLMRRCEGFCGVRVVTYAILDNHFHILVEVPMHKPLRGRSLLERMRMLYSAEYMKEVEVRWALWRKLGHEKLVTKDQERY